MEAADLKKTALDDDSILYNQPKEDSAGDHKSRWKDLHGRRKLKYFVDYYLAKILIAAAAIAILANLLYMTVFRREPEPIFYAAVMDTVMAEESKNALTEEIIALLDAQDQAKPVVVDDTFVLDNTGMKLSVFMSITQIDVMLCRRETFEAMAGQGLMMDLETLCDSVPSARQDLPADLWLEAHGYGSEPETAQDPAAYLGGKGELRPYGVDISSSSVIKKYLPDMENPVLAFAVNGKHIENGVLFLKYLLET